VSPPPAPDDADSDSGSAPAPVRFAVPPDLRTYAPEGAAAAAFDPATFSLSPADEATVPADPPFDRVHPAFPTGRAGVVAALLCARLDSLVLEREAVTALVAAAEDAGTDPFLLLDRLADAGVDPGFDIDRRARQLRQLV
jgi:hypothetical protein